VEFKTSSSPHLESVNSVSRMMRQVLLALIPGIAAATWFFGWGILINLVLATLLAVGFEAAILALRKRPIKPVISDCSAIVTAWLLVLALPPLAPWWLLTVGVFFAIVVAKQLYGGLGYNPFNPAMVGYVVLLISFPAPMTSWLTPASIADFHLGLWDSLQVVFSGTFPTGLDWDAVTAATPLDSIRSGLRQGQTISEIHKTVTFGLVAGEGWEWISAGYAVGGLWLLKRGIIGWQVPVSLLLALGMMAAAFSLYDPEYYSSPLYHLLGGGAMLGAFFIATDPVSGSTTPRGRLIFGAGVGILTFTIRSWGGYPDAIAFAVLLMNMAAPMIDEYTRPRIYGQNGRG
jgi:electron transport complex protein RnfD